MNIYIAYAKESNNTDQCAVVRAENKLVARALISRYCNRAVTDWIVVSIETRAGTDGSPIYFCPQHLKPYIRHSNPTESRVIYCHLLLMRPGQSECNLTDEILKMWAELEDQIALKVAAGRKAAGLAEREIILKGEITRNEFNLRFQNGTISQCRRDVGAIAHALGLSPHDGPDKFLSKIESMQQKAREKDERLEQYARHSAARSQEQHNAILRLSGEIYGIKVSLGLSDKNTVAEVLDKINGLREERNKVREALSAGSSLSTDKIVDQINLIHAQATQSTQFLHALLFMLNLKPDATQEQAQTRIKSLIDQVHNREMDLRSVAQELGLGITATADAMRKRIAEARTRFKAMSDAKAASNAHEDAINRICGLLGLAQSTSLGVIVDRVKDIAINSYPDLDRICDALELEPPVTRSVEVVLRRIEILKNKDLTYTAFRMGLVSTALGIEQTSSMDQILAAIRDNWIRHCHAHWAFIAVPKAKSSDGRELAFSLCEQLGIGVIEVGVHKTWIRSYPRLHKRVSSKFKDAVRPEHKTFALAGSKGSFWSPWRESVERLKKEVEREPGKLIIEVLKNVTHHWANNRSATSCISTQIREGIIKGIFIKDGRLYSGANS